MENLVGKAISNLGISLPDGLIDISDILARLHIKKVYIISMTGRCGSTWLASELACFGNAGRPSEYFSEQRIPHEHKDIDFSSVEEFLESLIQKGRTGETFGFKIDANRLRWLSEIIDIKASFSSLEPVWIDMRRRNIVKQGISFLRAKQTGVWHVFQGSGRSVDASKIQNGAFEDNALWSEINRIRDAEEWLDSFYRSNDIRPMRIVYEDMVDSSAIIIRRILFRIGWNDVHGKIEDKEGEGVIKTIKIGDDNYLAGELEFVSRNIAAIERLLSERDIHDGY
ncbi:Stf0 family sulfotransferase [Pararhodobacter zhoushanensis]|uniref:Stf0 family sulfotransferase n=1 Tax=Pararhodobacter zhoushanensis TaxID=2479545 RepID=UPI000F8CD979|nr:Stf0 family sulfotransferase [Pararhodobacter zhoushanensis]